MKANFIDANSVMSKKNVNEKKVEKFIDEFNLYIVKQSQFGALTFSLNDGLSPIPSLNTDEFNVCVEMAKLKGWELTQHEDNYHTTSYKMQKL